MMNIFHSEYCLTLTLLSTFIDPSVVWMFDSEWLLSDRNYINLQSVNDKLRSNSYPCAVCCYQPNTEQSRVQPAGFPGMNETVEINNKTVESHWWHRKQEQQPASCHNYIVIIYNHRTVITYNSLQSLSGIKRKFVYYEDNWEEWWPQWRGE